MIQYLLTVSICWIALYVVYHCFLRKETFFSINRGYLMGSLILGLLIPAYQWIPAEWYTHSEPITYFAFADSAISITSSSESVSIWNLKNVLISLYWIGALIMLSKLFHGLLRIRTLNQTGEHVDVDGLPIIYTNRYHLPFSFWQSIYISKDLPLKEEIESILNHEQVHIKEWHSLDILTIELMHVLFWFNPILILYKKAIQQSHEYVADASVIQDIPRKSYGQLLLKQSQSGLEIALANHFFHSQIKKRITMMYQEKSKRPAMVKYLAAIPVLALLLIVFSSNTSNKDDVHEKDIIETVEANVFTNQESDEPRLTTKVDSLPQEYKSSSTQTSKMQKTNFTFETHGNVAVKYSRNASGKVDFVEIDDDGTETSDRTVLKEVLSAFLKGEINDERKFILDQNFPNPWKESTTINISVQESINGELKVYNVEGKTVYSKEMNLNKGTTSIQINKTDLNVKHGVLYYQLKVGEDEQTRKMIFGNGGKAQSVVSDDEIYKVVQQMPRFPGCEDVLSAEGEKGCSQCANQKMLEYIYTNLKYPSEARKAGVEGMAVVQFVVKTDGSIDAVKVVRDPGSGLGDEAARVVETFNSMDEKWTAGLQQGKKVKVLYTLPIRYKLEGDKVGEEDTKELKEVLEINIGQGDEKPLIVLDGKIIEIGLKEIKPDDIKTVNVLKGTAAERKYGKKGIHGVVEVVTKDGAKLTAQNQSDEDEIFKVVEQMPRFPGCEGKGLDKKEADDCARQAMLTYIYKNIKYPKEAVKNKIEGVSVIEFIVMKDGSIKDAKILRDPGSGTGDESLRVVNTMNDMADKWTPGQQRGKTVNVRYVLPVKYKLEGGEKKEEVVETRQKLELSKFTAAPNPSKDQFRLSFEGEAKPISIRITDISGRVLYSEEVNDFNGKYNKEISSQEFINTVAIISILQGDKMYTEKMVFTP